MSAPQRSVAGRMRLATLAVAAVSVAVVFVTFYVAWLDYTVRLRSEELSRQVAALARGIETSGIPQAGTPTGETRARLFRVQGGLIGARLSVTDAEGNVVLSSATEGPRVGEIYPVGELHELDERGVALEVRTLPDVGRVLLAATPLEGEGGFLVATQAVRDVNAAQRRILPLLTGAALMALAVAYIAGTLVARRLTGPVVRLQEAAEDVATGLWGREVVVEGDDEVARLATAFNGMSRRVAAAYDAQRDFVGNVSHELKTPITSLQGFARALVDGTAADEETRERYLGIIQAEAARLSELTGTLLALADLDSGRVPFGRAPIEMSRVAETLMARFESAAAQKCIEFEIVENLASAGRPLGDEARLLQALSAVVANAIHHAPAGGRVRVATDSRDSVWLATIDDSGPGIPPERREDVFGRFVRLDASRSAASGGSGLGLPITRRILELMEGRISIEDSDLGGARFVIELPRA